MNANSEPNFLGIKKTFGIDIASIFFSYFPPQWRTQIIKIGFSIFFYPNSKLMKNIVGGISNIPKRYPTIINAHANKKIRVKVLVIVIFKNPNFHFSCSSIDTFFEDLLISIVKERAL